MRAFLMAIGLLLAGAQLAEAAPITNRTNMSFDDQHGTQVEYLQSGGAAFLWYPGNGIVLPGHWKAVAGKGAMPAQLCFRYGPNTYNPVTHVYGDVWECEDARLYSALQIEQANGDVFGLAHRGPVPFVLQKTRTTIEQLAQQVGVKAAVVATATPRPPSAPSVAASESTMTCSSIFANAHANREATIMAALTYYHAEYMGKPCGTADYQMAFGLLREAGDDSDAAALLADLKIRAASGNPRAVAALATVRAGH